MPAGTALSDRLLNARLTEIESILLRLESLSGELRVDPSGNVGRSATDLRAAFAARGAIEPAVGRMLESLVVLRGIDDGARHDNRRDARDVDCLRDVLERELLPMLRPLGFDL